MAEKLNIAVYLCSKTDPLIIEFAVKLAAFVLLFFSPQKRKTAGDNFRAMNLRSGLPDVYRVFYNMAFNIVVFFRTLGKGMDEIQQNIIVTGAENLDKIPKDRGCVVVTCHLGLWDLAAKYLSLLGFDVAAVAEFKNVGSFHYEFLKKVRGSESVEILPLEDKSTSLRLAKFAKKTKGVIALVGDRDISGSGREAVFFGRSSTLPVGPAYMAARLDIPVLIGYLVRTKAWKYKAYISEPFYLPKCEFEKKVLTQKYFDWIKINMEKIIREHPDQWIMFRPPWKNEKKT
ncbi:lysophospholipid acyltransferase family protein [candidate division WOR-3 bacterium]|nr:lysophospholipid acyltransferase family protein [candidate division WOR-3 bacterium]